MRSWYSIPEGYKAELTWVMVIPKIVYPQNMVIYLRNSREASWLGIESAAEGREVQRPNQPPIEPPPKYLPKDDDALWLGSKRRYGSCL